MKVHFRRPFSWVPPAFRGRVSVRYPPGLFRVPRACGAAAIAAGAADLVCEGIDDDGRRPDEPPAGVRPARRR